MVTQSKLFKNYFSLSIYQVINFAVPLIIIPVVIDRVGIFNFGLIAFSYAFANYFNVIVDYGFNLSATKKISINRNSQATVNTIFSTVYISKLIFLLISFSIYSILIYSLPVLRQQWLLHICSFTIVLGQALIPVWLFQGIEDMKYLAICNILSKLAYFVCILLYIKLPTDYYLVNFLQGTSTISAGWLSIYICFKKFNTRFAQVSISDIIAEIKEGKMLFFSSVAVNLYINSNVFILGIFTTPAEVGIYSVAEKVYLALKQLDNVFSQVIFPRICLLAQQSVLALQKFLKKTFIPFFIFVISICTVVFCTKSLISRYFLKGIVDSRFVHLITIFCIVVIVNACNTPTFQTLLAYNATSKYGLVLITGCIINIISNIILAHFFQSLGTAYAVLITEFFITTGLGYFFFTTLRQKKI